MCRNFYENDTRKKIEIMELFEIESKNENNNIKPILPAVPLSEVYLEDCVKALKRYADNHFDLAVVDKINMILLLLYQSIFCIFV